MEVKDKIIGILGGGQLGKMLSLEAQKWDVNLWILDKSKDFPAASVCSKFVEGDFTNFDDVYQFGKQVDVLSIEIENVNIQALLQLQKEGLSIHPAPEKLAIIQDKGLQKQFYKQNKLPSPDFRLWNSSEDILQAIADKKLYLPFVQKTRKAGYDGRGVSVIAKEEDLNQLLPGASLTEELVEIDKELAVIVCRNERGETAVFPPVDMVFDPDANLVEFVRAPAAISSSLSKEAENLALSTMKSFGICGLLAVEMFLTKDGKLLINEVAPRPHNSGHHTLDNCYTSQFEQHLRALLGLSPGSTRFKMPAVMVNILGEPGYSGTAKYAGWEDCLAIEGVNIHLYGKKKTSPYRKMGHVTVVDQEVENALAKAKRVKQILKVIA
jgi:5-(carboxyamino)imidazole ribonucleotide synthase